MSLKRYRFEIEALVNDLEFLEEGNYYEIVKKPGIASAKTQASKIKKDLLRLLEKIANNEVGVDETMRDFKLF